MWWTDWVSTPKSEWSVSVAGERFRVELRPRRGHLFEYDYTWLTGPNDGYGFGESGPVERGEPEHRERIRWFLGEIDPSTGYLAEE